MEEIKQHKNKTFKVKLNPEITEQSLQNLLEDQQKCSKLQLKIRKYYLQGHSLILSFLSQQRGLISFNIVLQEVISFDFLNIFIQLENIPSLKQLKLSIRDTIINKLQDDSLGKRIKNLTNLEELEIELKSSQLKNYEFLQLSQAFMTLSNLIKLKIYVNDIYSSKLITQLCEDMRNLVKLEVFEFQVSDISLQCIQDIINCIALELSFFQTLKEIQIKINQKYNYYWDQLGNYDINSLCKTLKKLQPEKLLLEIPQNEFKDHFKGFEDFLLFQNNLKYLEIKYECTKDESILSLLNSITKINQLEDTILRFKINKIQNYDNDINLLGEILSKIKSLTILDVNFNLDLKKEDITILKGYFCNNQGLKQLFIQFPQSFQLQNLSEEQLKEGIDLIEEQKLFQYNKSQCKDNREDQQMNQMAILCLEEIQKQIQNSKYCDGSVQQNYIESSYQQVGARQQIDILVKLNQNDNSTYPKIAELSIYKYKNPKLKTLKLTWTGQEINQTLLQSLGSNLSTLNQLSVINLQILEGITSENNGLSCFIQFLRLLTNLKELTLKISRMNIEENHLVDFISCFQYLVNLKSLDLIICGDKQFNNDQQKEFVNQFILPFKLTKLSIDIENEKIESMNLLSLMKNISLLKKLKYLNLTFDYNFFSLIEIIHLKEIILSMKNLQKVYFSSIDLLPLSTPLFFQDNPFFEQIHLKTVSKNKIRQSNYCLKKIDEQIKIGNHIEYQISLTLDITYMYNYYKNIQVTNEFENFFHSHQILTHLDLAINGDNTLSCETIQNVLLNISLLIKLKSFKFNFNYHQNNLTFDHIILLGNSICSLQNLEILELEIQTSSKTLQIIEANSFLQDITCLSKLKELTLKFNSNENEQIFNLNQLIQNISMMKGLKKVSLTFAFIQFVIDNQYLIQMISNLEGLLELRLYLFSFLENKTQELDDVYKIIEQHKQLNKFDILINYDAPIKIISKMKRLVIMDVEYIY